MRQQKGNPLSNTRTQKRVARFIRNERTARHLTQEDFANVLGVSRGFLSDIERGTKAISVDTLVTFTRKLGVSSDAILGLS